MGNEAENERVKHMMNIVPGEWDVRPMHLANEIREFLHTVKDEGTSIDRGGGDGIADLWVTVGGTEFTVKIKSPQPPAEDPA